MRSLQGVHAKISILDECAIVTSANLTGPGFTKRREIGILLDSKEWAGVMKVFNAWWESAKEIPHDSIAEWERCPKDSGSDEDAGCLRSGRSLLGPAQNCSLRAIRSDHDFATYRKFLQHYQQVADAYERVQRLWPEAPRFLEIDAVLNYLFHDAENTPSFARTITRWLEFSNENRRWRENCPVGCGDSPRLAIPVSWWSHHGARGRLIGA